MMGRNHVTLYLYLSMSQSSLVLCSVSAKLTFVWKKEHAHHLKRSQTRNQLQLMLMLTSILCVLPKINLNSKYSMSTRVSKVPDKHLFHLVVSICWVLRRWWSQFLWSACHGTPRKQLDFSPSQPLRSLEVEGEHVPWHSGEVSKSFQHEEKPFEFLKPSSATKSGEL